MFALSLSPSLPREGGERPFSPHFVFLQVLFRAKDVESQLSSQVVRGNHTLSVLLAGLRKYLLYEIQVLAFTRIGDGAPSSPPVIERTKDDGECGGWWAVPVLGREPLPPPGFKNPGSPILSGPAPAGAAVPSWLPLHPLGPLSTHLLALGPGAQ